MPKIVTKDSFQETLDKLHNKKYEIIGNYIDAHEPTQFKCTQCSIEFEQSPNKLKTRKRCPCETTNTILDFTKIESQIRTLHNGNYTLEEKNYASANKKMVMKCKKHGEFMAKPHDVIVGKIVGCKQCGKEQFVNNVRKDTAGFIGEAKAVHGDKYDYSKTKYVTAHEDTVIICTTHGIFLQSPSNHIRGRGCPKCASVRTGEALKNKITQ